MKTKTTLLGLIKVCHNPNCEAIYHCIPKKHTRFDDCNGWVILINEETYWKKFSNNWFQYNFETKKYYRPQLPKIQIEIPL